MSPRSGPAPVSLPPDAAGRPPGTPHPGARPREPCADCRAGFPDRRLSRNPPSTNWPQHVAHETQWLPGRCPAPARNPGGTGKMTIFNQTGPAAAGAPACLPWCRRRPDPAPSPPPRDPGHRPWRGRRVRFAPSAGTNRKNRPGIARRPARDRRQGSPRPAGARPGRTRARTGPRTSQAVVNGQRATRFSACPGTSPPGNGAVNPSTMRSSCGKPATAYPHAPVSPHHCARPPRTRITPPRPGHGSARTDLTPVAVGTPAGGLHHRGKPENGTKGSPEPGLPPRTGNSADTARRRRPVRERRRGAGHGGIPVPGAGVHAAASVGPV